MSLKWSFDSGGAINHPVVVADDKVLFVPHNGTLIALDAASGILRWEYEAPAKVWERAYVSDGERIFVGLEGGKLVGLDVRSGEVLWETNLGINVQVPPLVVDDLLYVSTTFVGPGLIFDLEKKVKIFVLHASDGLELWSFQTDNYILQMPYIDCDRVYVAGTFYSPVEIDEGGHTRIYALSTVDGSEQWQFESEDGFPKQIYATPSSVVFLGY